MKKITYLSLWCLLLAPTLATAQLSISGEIRPRTELYGGNNVRLKEKGESLGLATQQRSRLNFDYQDKEGLKIVFSPQVVHFWGQMPQAYDLLGKGVPGSAEPVFSVFEAYAQYKVSDLYTLKAGRQAISYADERWFGALGWAASGRAHDAFVNKFTLGKIKADIGLAINRTKHFQGVDSVAFTQVRGGYNSMQYLWLTLPADDLKIEAMATNIVSKSSLTSTSIAYDNTITFGILPSYTLDQLEINASAYWQSGAANRKASLYAVDITYKGLGLPLTLGADIVSGDDPTSPDNEAWLQPFGTNHKFYGFMDFFYVGPGEAVGLNDIYLKAVFKTGKKSKLIGFVHNFSTNQDIENLDGEMESGSYGTEVDLVYDLKVSSSFNFKLGYSTIFATELMEAYKGGSSEEFNQWAWLQLTFNPKFS